jgi:hypothetical protein
MLALFAAAASLHAATKSDERAYIGLGLDTTPLPDLLVTHLRLAPDQGLRIKNVMDNSPADRARLQRDDIIIGFQGRDVNDLGEFCDAVREAGVGTEVELEYIHLGQRKTVKLKLEDWPDDCEWKYPPEPVIQHYWHPGKIFRKGPGDANWIEVPPFGDIPLHFQSHGTDDSCTLSLLGGFYHYHHCEDGKCYTITIEGNPNDKDTKIVVRDDDEQYETTVGKINELPKYRATATRDLKNARKVAKQRKRMKQWPPNKPQEWEDLFGQSWKHWDQAPFPFCPPGSWQDHLEDYGKKWKDFYQQPDLIQPEFIEPFEDRLKKLDKKMEEKMRGLQGRIEQLEKQRENMMDRLLEKLGKMKSFKEDKSEKQEESEYENI